jgi:cyclopropane-fatty-acyl-phospholipid synthase
MEDLFVVEDLHNFGPHYVKTLRAWNDNFHRKWNDMRQRHDDHVRRMFEYFFLISAALFRARTMEYWHLVMTRQGAAQPPCRIGGVERAVPMFASASGSGR